MALQKNSQKSTNDFAQLGDLVKSQQQPMNKETTMPIPNMAATDAASDKATLSDEQVLELAKNKGFDISQPHPLVKDFVSALNPYGADLAEEGSHWVLTLASDDRKNPMSLHDFIVESYRDPLEFIMHITVNQGVRNARMIKKVDDLIQQSVVVANENRNLKEELGRLKADLQQRSKLAELEKDFNKALDQVVDDAVADMTNGFNEAKEARRSTSCLTPPVKVTNHRPTKAAKTVPTGPELVTIRVEEPSFWEEAAKAAVTGVVVGAAVYGTICALDHFFGGDE